MPGRSKIFLALALSGAIVRAVPLMDPVCARYAIEAVTELRNMAQELIPILLGPVNQPQFQLMILIAERAKREVPHGQILRLDRIPTGFLHLTPAEVTGIVREMSAMGGRVILIEEEETKYGLTEDGRLYLALNLATFRFQAAHEMDHATVHLEMAASMGPLELPLERKMLLAAALAHTPLGSMYMESQANAITIAEATRELVGLPAQWITDANNYPLAVAIGRASLLIDQASDMTDDNGTLTNFGQLVTAHLERDRRSAMRAIVETTLKRRDWLATQYAAWAARSHSTADRDHFRDLEQKYRARPTSIRDYIGTELVNAGNIGDIRMDVLENYYRRWLAANRPDLVVRP